jgi:Asp-tRNA(Asn)/Glu-tRNA(Gln) amidotransferase B subunit
VSHRDQYLAHCSSYDLPKIVNDSAEVVLYMDDISLIITSLNPTNFTNSANAILQDINKWFTTNLLSLNANKTQYMQFVTKTSSLIDLHKMYKNKEMANTSNKKILGLTLTTHFPGRYNCTQT